MVKVIAVVSNGSFGGIFSKNDTKADINTSFYNN